MFNCQQALITYLKMELLGSATGQAKTIKEYAGELRDANQLTELRPVILAKYHDGFPRAQAAWHQLDLIVVTDSVVFDQTENQNTSLQLAANVLDYVTQKPDNKKGIFTKIGGHGTYYIDPEKIRAETILIIERFNIVRIQLFINDNTQNL